MIRDWLWAASLVISCRGSDVKDAPKEESRASADTVPNSAQADWRVYEGSSFRLRYPPDAVIQPRSHSGDLAETTIRGPQIHVSVPPDVGPSDGPAYELVVSVAANASHKTTAQWVDSVRQQANEEMDSDSLDFLAEPDTVMVNGVQALRLRPFCGDCAAEEIYLAGQHETVMLSYVFDISFPGDRAAQRRVYQAMLNTFAWKP